MIAKLTQGMELMGAIIDEFGKEDVPWAVLSQNLKKKGSKKLDAFRLSWECRLNPIPPSSQDQAG